MEARKLCHSCYCRLCAEENKNGTYLFSQEGSSENLSQLVNKYLPLKVEEDNKYPTKICPGCHIQLEATKLFMDLIVKGQMKLREMYRNQQELIQKEDRQMRKLQEALQSVSPDSTLQTYAIQTDKSGEFQSFVQIISEGPLFFPDHELSLSVAGLEKPRRKRGRPAKQIQPPETEAENQEKETEKLITQEENEEELEGSDGRRRRKIRPPAKYAELVQGDELESMLKKEGIINEEEYADYKVTEDGEGVIIGTVKLKNSEDSGEPIYVRSKPKADDGTRKSLKKKRYKCEFCEKIYVDFGKYELHKKTHMFNYTCKESGCLFETSNKKQFLDHQHQTGHIEHSIVEISEKNSKENVEELINVTESNTSSESDDHKTRNQCKICLKDFSSLQALMVHVKGVHNREKPFACNKCDRSFSYKKSLKIHILSHLKDSSDKPQYPCDKCDKILRHPSGLVYHKAAEHGDGKEFVCNQCGKSFKICQQLQRHQMVHSSQRPFECLKCPATFKTQSNLANHQLVHTGERKYCCSKCGQKFAHKTSLVLHKRWHDGDKPFKCEFCEKSFTQKGNLAEHKRIHTGEKPYCCEHCGRSFTTSSQFKLHMKRHTGEKPLVCQFCTKTFLHRETYKTHIRRHLNEKPFACRLCSRSFPEAWALKRHVRVHTKEKPYKCDVCNKAFADSSNKQKHLRSHNVNEVMRIINKSHSSENSEKQKTQSSKINIANLQLTQLIDPHGNPISITTQDGQNIPVVTDNDESMIQGLLPDGSLIPINLDKNLIEEEVEASRQRQNIINLQIQSDMGTLKEEVLETGNQTLGNANIQLITDENGQEMCLVTYSLEENRDDVNQSLGSTIFLAPT